MGLFKGINKVRANFGANYERGGHYLMFIRRVKKDSNRHDEDFVAVEKVCLKVISPLNEPNPHHVGESCTHLMADYGPGKDYFLPNLKAMLSRVFGVPDSEVTEESMELVVGDGQPMAGLIVEMQNQQFLTKEKKERVNRTYIRTLTKEEAEEQIGRDVIEKHLTKEELHNWDNPPQDDE
jgi:hypothetical protein